ncbi:uncharacterized protein [Lolium perenne]|uniref:uncharacterized protein n=1 Tax=Lolium perenne TaxID=4522 RepID=UPI003A9A4D65
MEQEVAGAVGRCPHVGAAGHGRPLAVRFCAEAVSCEVIRWRTPLPRASAETKVAEVDEFYIAQCLGPSFDGFVFLPADETRGGVVMAWDTSMIQINHVSFDTFAITGEVTARDDSKWWLTIVYGPQAAEEKVMFLEELSERRSLCPGPWVVAGDFNMILNASEKNNENLDRGMMQRFRAFVHEHELKDLYMQGRAFTWSNERERATLTRIDRVLVSVDWDLQHFDSVLQGLSSSVSDHAPLHLALNAAFRPKRRFKFENFWLKLEGFDEAVRNAWVCDPDIVDPFRKLDALFGNAAEYLQSWGQKRVGNIKLNIAIANTLILRLDVAQERRVLAPREIWLRRMLKQAVLGLASLERTMARQRSRIRWLKDGDANTAFFHAVANGRRVKNHIAAVKVGDELVTDQGLKVVAFTEAYSQLLGQVQTREHSINLDELDIPTAELQDLDVMFTEEEVWGVVKDLPPR